MKRREVLKSLILYVPAAGAVATLLRERNAGASTSTPKKLPLYGMGIRVDQCIGCGQCVEACKAENNVPAAPFYTRTWVERYRITTDGEVYVAAVEPGLPGREDSSEDKHTARTFFVPKLCNQCNSPPCVQVCPVGATFATGEGIVLIDDKRCVGCRYCVQACPYGARYIHPEKQTADKCTFCFHRLKRGLAPACVEACPTGARIIGDLTERADVLTRFRRMNKLHQLKPELNTEPKVYYAGLDGEVR